MTSIILHSFHCVPYSNTHETLIASHCSISRLLVLRTGRVAIQRQFCLAQRQRCSDAGKMSQPLGEIRPQQLTLRIVLLGEQTEVVGRPCRAVECRPGLVIALLVGETFRQPELTGEKGAFRARQAVRRVVTFQQPVESQSRLDRGGRAQHALIPVVDKTDRGNTQQGSVEIAVFE